jgi:hypothetical protein
MAEHRRRKRMALLGVMGPSPDDIAVRAVFAVAARRLTRRNCSFFAGANVSKTRRGAPAWDDQQKPAQLRSAKSCIGTDTAVSALDAQGHACAMRDEEHSFRRTAR